MEFADFIKTPKMDGVFLHDHLHGTVEGTLCITGHHLLLSARQENSQELWVSTHTNSPCTACMLECIHVFIIRFFVPSVNFKVTFYNFI